MKINSHSSVAIAVSTVYDYIRWQLKSSSQKTLTMGKNKFDELDQVMLVNGAAVVLFIYKYSIETFLRLRSIMHRLNIR